MMKPSSEVPGPWHVGRDYNPFSVQRHGPGNMEYVFQSTRHRDRLRRLLNETGWRLELVGKHGVGKSTLLRTIEGWAAEQGMETIRLRCSREVPRLPWLFWRDIPDRGGVVFLDGGERCPKWQLWLLARIARKRGMGLVMTSHRRMGIGRPVRVKTTEQQLGRVVAQLLEEPVDKGCQGGGRRDHLNRLLKAYEGSAREVIFRLYDEWESEMEEKG